jgi:hypothetical protein
VFVQQVCYGKSFSHVHVFGSDRRAR